MRTELSLTNTKSQHSLSLWDACAISTGIIIGPGIFETAPAVAQAVSGLSEILSLWLVGAILSYCGILCYSELAARYPENGGEYAWLRAAYGQRLANLYLWAEVAILKPGIIAAMAFPSARYILAVWPTIQLPQSVIASLMVFFLTMINLYGFHAGKRSQNILSAAKVAGLSLIILTGLYAGSHSTQPMELITEGTKQHDYGLALILVLFTFGGWSDIANVTADIQSGARGLLRSASVSLGLITILYVLVNFAFVNLLGVHNFSIAEVPVAVGLQQILPGSAATLVYILIAVSCLGAIQGTMFTGARLYTRISPSCHKETNQASYRLAFLSQGALSILVIILTQSFINAVVYTTTVVWVFFLLKALAVPILRAKTEELASIQVPLYPAPLVVFVASCVFLIWSAFKYDPLGSAIAAVVVLMGVFVPYCCRLASKMRL